MSPSNPIDIEITQSNGYNITKSYYFQCIKEEN